MIAHFAGDPPPDSAFATHSSIVRTAHLRGHRVPQQAETTSQLPMTWSTNATLAEIAASLRAARHIVVLTHVKPDGDAVGSSIGMVRALNRPSAWSKGPRAEAWYFGPQPPWLPDVAGQTPHRVVMQGEALPQESAVDAVLILDTGSWTQLEAVQPWLASRRAMTSVVDHHVTGNPEVGSRLHVDTNAAAVCQPAAELARLVLELPSLASLPADVAEAFYLGLATDTGWFRHSNVSRGVMETAGQLLDAGADHTRLYRLIEQRETPERLKLLSRALASLELLDEGRLAVMKLSRKDFQETKAQPGESGGFVDFGQSIPTVLVTCVLTEAAPGEYGPSSGSADAPITKISLRSKPIGGPANTGVDVNVLAKELGGGGHVRAAGARTSQTLDQTATRVLELTRLQTAPRK